MNEHTHRRIRNLQAFIFETRVSPFCALCDKAVPIPRGALCCFVVRRSEYVTLTLTWTIQVKGRQAAQVQPRAILLQPALPITNHIRGTG